MVTQPLTDTPERTHDALLMHLKRKGEKTVSELCELLGITSMAVRRHLAGLQKDGLVDSHIVRKSRGRPTYYYHLTDKAESLFPSGFQNLAQDILDAVFEKSGHTGVMEILTLRNDRLARQLKAKVAGMSLADRVKAVVQFFSDNGYMTEYETLPDGNFLIFQRHCAVHDLANKYRQLCGLEPKLIEETLGVKVTRQQYMLNKDPVCGYLVEDTERTQTASAG
jgi:predicted ArsR family transcriptional regulator